MRFRILLAALLLAPLSLWATPNYVGFTSWCQRGAIFTTTQGLLSTTPVQGSFPSCSIQVNVHGGGPATLYSSNTGAALANPFTAQAIGLYQFFVDTNATGIEYDITLSGGNSAFPAPVTLYDIFLGGTGGGGGSGVTSLTGDGALITNTAATGAVTLTVGTFAAHTFWGNNTGSPATAAKVVPACGDLSDATYFCNAASPLNAAHGGTGLDTSASTGVAQLAAGTWSVSTALANGTTATTQSPGDNTTKAATDAFVLANAGAISGLTTNGCVTAASATTVQTPTGYTCNPATGLSFAAPTGTGVGLIIAGDAASSDIFRANKNSGALGFKVSSGGNVTAAGSITGGSLIGTGLTISGSATIGGASAVTSIGLTTTAGSNTFQTPSAATGLTWNLPAISGTLVPAPYRQQLTAQTSAIGDTTMLTSGAATTLYTFAGAIACETTASAATVVLTLKWTDPTGAAQSRTSGTVTCTTPGAAFADQLTYTFVAQAATAVKWATTIANSPVYTVSVRLLQP